MHCTTASELSDDGIDEELASLDVDTIRDDFPYMSYQAT